MGSAQRNQCSEATTLWLHGQCCERGGGVQWKVGGSRVSRHMHGWGGGQGIGKTQKPEGSYSEPRIAL